MNDAAKELNDKDAKIAQQCKIFILLYNKTTENDYCCMCEAPCALLIVILKKVQESLPFKLMSTVKKINNLLDEMKVMKQQMQETEELVNARIAGEIHSILHKHISFLTNSFSTLALCCCINAVLSRPSGQPEEDGEGKCSNPRRE